MLEGVGTSIVFRCVHNVSEAATYMYNLPDKYMSFIEGDQLKEVMRGCNKQMGISKL